nr:hypothetical protein [uncultured Albidiferax sp.]
MPEANWDAFTRLPGAQDRNFEQLCRGLVRRHYGRFGHFKELANQAGVEFHLQLTQSCDQGTPPQWIGWQCKWYELKSGTAIGTTRRNTIVDGIEKSRKHVPGLTDWKLWTRHKLTRGDQTWFYGLQLRFPDLKLHLLTATDLEDLLVGHGALLLESYFGELVVTPQVLLEQYKRAAAPFKHRYQPEVHQVVGAERDLQRYLASPGAWGMIPLCARELRINAAEISARTPSLPAPLQADVNALLARVKAEAGLFDVLYECLQAGQFDKIREQLATHPAQPIRYQRLYSRLLSARWPGAPYSANLIADLHQAALKRRELEAAISQRTIAIQGGAGQGKSELAVRTTEPTEDFPGGVLLLGKDLHARQGFDELASAFKIAGRSSGSFARLVEALDAAGQRAGRRLPIVVDGLNEAENPRAWKDELARTDELLKDFPHVLLVVTLREEFVQFCLPEGFPIQDHRGFEEDSRAAIISYFRHYKIDATDADLPLELLQHPLTLRIFCEVANPSRQHTVGAEALPGSRAALFEAYFQKIAERIADLAPIAHPIYQDDVNKGLRRLASLLWDSNERNLDFDQARTVIDRDCHWDHSLIRALESASVLIRTVARTGEQAIAFAYDMMAGHQIAKHLLTQPTLPQWLQGEEARAAFQSKRSGTHTFSSDVFRALVSLYPKRWDGRQLWQDLPQDMCLSALLLTAEADAAHIGRDTVERFAQEMRISKPFAQAAFRKLRHTRAAHAHPFDANFLHGVLEGMSNTERDLCWTEWVRSRSDELEEDVLSLIERWKSTHLGEREVRRARWVLWTLSSTSRYLRDLGTKALFQFALRRPAEFFRLALEAAAISDPYIPERVFAAAYGAALSTWSDEAAAEMRMALPDAAAHIVAEMFRPDAPHPVWHALYRQYCLGIVALARRIQPDCITPEDAALLQAPFAHLPSPFEQLPAYGEEIIERAADAAINMDFGNYTMGRLIPNRANYDDKHPMYLQVRHALVARMVQLGYHLDEFDKIDHGMTSGSRIGGNQHKIDRYGKKYSWIAFFEMWGVRHARALLNEDRGWRPPDADIDPTFPPEAKAIVLPSPELFSDQPKDMGEWLQRGPRPDYRAWLVRDAIDSILGSWVALNGFVKERSPQDYREVFTFLRGVFVAKSRATALTRVFNRMQYPGNTAIPDQDEHYYTYAGEMPFAEIPGLIDPPRHVRSAGREQNGEEDYDDDAEEDFGTEYQPRVSAQGWGEGGIPVELPTQEYAWESYHSALNTASATSLPSTKLCEALGLHYRAGQWDLHDALGIASMFRKIGEENALGDARAEGWLSYLRADLLKRYLQENDLCLVWLMWGERNIHHRAARSQDLHQHFANNEHIHKRSQVYGFG